MPDEALMPLQAGTGLNQALRFHSRERRRSHVGLPGLFRTHFEGIPTSPLLATQYPTRNVPITFRTVIRITGAAPAGLIFEIGDATTAIAAWIDDTDVSLRAGDVPAADRALATFDNGVSLPDTLELDLVFSVRPGDGRVRIWGNGQEIARDVASGGAFPNGWAASSNGAFAAAAVGALPADVAQTGAPSNFDVIEPLSVFVGQVPRHFI
jgi:hypothetical protein